MYFTQDYLGKVTLQLLILNFTVNMDTSASMKRKNQLNQLLSDKFFSYFHDKKIAQKEWDLLWSSTLTPLEIWQLIINRINRLEKIKNLSWDNPIHVVARSNKYQEISSYSEAINLLDAAKRYYYKFYQKRLQGNLVLDCEIGFNHSTNGAENPIFNIHVHIICENDQYKTYLNTTKHLRVGKSLRNHKISTRKAFRKHNTETDAEYVLKVANYNSKFALLQGFSRANRRANNLPYSNTYLKAKLNKNFIRIVKKGGKTNKNQIRKQLKHWFIQFKAWEVLKQKQIYTVYWNGFSAKPVKIEKMPGFHVLPPTNFPYYLEYDTI